MGAAMTEYVRTAILTSVAALALALPASAQELPDSYMGIDLTQDAAVEAQQRHLELEMRPLLDEGVELGCLAFDPPSTFSQVPNESDACREYMPRLIAFSQRAEAIGDVPEGEGGSLDDAVADTLRSVPLVPLAQLAQRGDKRAQLELGIRFEEGIGVDVDFDRALELYTQAGRTTRGRSQMRFTPAGNSDEDGARPASMNRRDGVRIPGLPEARERRAMLEARMEAATQ